MPAILVFDVGKAIDEYNKIKNRTKIGWVDFEKSYWKVTEVCCECPKPAET